MKTLKEIASEAQHRKPDPEFSRPIAVLHRAALRVLEALAVECARNKQQSDSETIRKMIEWLNTWN